MEALRFRTVVPKNHRVEITLPDEVPEGPTELFVVVETPLLKPVNPEEGRRNSLLRQLGELDALRKRFEGRDVRLSEAVAEERRQED